VKAICIASKEIIVARSLPTRENLWLHDFATIFAHAWYRDFPIQKTYRDAAKRADWTIHLGIAVRSTAELLGLFSHFESGGRTDAVLRDASKNAIAALEWEWTRLQRQPKELRKLKDNCTKKEFTGLRFACLIGYSKEHEAATDLAWVEPKWDGVPIPLLLVVIHFRWKLDQRHFTKLTLHRIQNGKAVLLREQPAYPWEVKGARWASADAPAAQ
jgi:hypothetical protein